MKPLEPLRRIRDWAAILGEAAYYCAIDLGDALWRMEQRAWRALRRVL